MSWEMSLVLKATVLLGVMLAAVALFRGTRASRRHLILVSTFAALAVLPLAGTLTPVVAVPLPIAAAAIAGAVEAPPIAGVEMTLVSPRPGDGAQQTPASSRPSLTTTLRGLWLLGVAGILTMLGGSLWSLYRLRRSGVPWMAGQAMAETMAREAGLNRRVTVMLHERTAVPATMGGLRPAILLPPEARHWAEPDLRRVLLHELEHVRRGDWWIHLCARAVCTLYWFHPLVWIALRRLRVEAERACDDAVVQRMDRADYADQLVTLAERLSSPLPRLMLSMANRSDLSKRVSAILNPRQRRGRAGTVAAATIMGIVALLVGTVASLQAVSARQGPVINRAVAGQPVSIAPAIVRDVDQLQVPSMAQDVAPAQSPSRVVDAAPAPYVIGPDDVLTISVWRQEELSRDVLVRPDGKISLPLVGDVQAAGSTPDRLRQLLIEAFTPFVSNPNVVVIVRQINSRKVFIVGAVVKPGLYQLSESMTVLQLIAVAGGLTEFAKRDAIAVVRRRVDGKNVVSSFNYQAFVRGLQPEQNVLLQPGDTVVVE